MLSLLQVFLDLFLLDLEELRDQPDAEECLERDRESLFLDPDFLLAEGADFLTSRKVETNFGLLRCFE